MFNLKTIFIVAITSPIIISDSKCGIIYETRRIKRLEEHTASLHFPILAKKRDKEATDFTGYERIFVGDGNAIVRRPTLIYEDYLNEFRDKISPEGPLDKYAEDICEAICTEFNFARSNEPIRKLSTKIDCKIANFQRAIFCQMEVDEWNTIDWYLLQGPVSKNKEKGGIRSGVFLATKDPLQEGVSICDYFESDHQGDSIQIYSYEVIYDNFAYFPKSLALAFYHFIVTFAQNPPSENAISTEQRQQVGLALSNAKEHREHFQRSSTALLNVDPDQTKSSKSKINKNSKKSDLSQKSQASGKGPESLTHGTPNALKSSSPSSPTTEILIPPKKSVESLNNYKGVSNSQGVKSSTSVHSTKLKASTSQQIVIPISQEAQAPSSPEGHQSFGNKIFKVLPRISDQKSTTIRNDPSIERSSSGKNARLQKSATKARPPKPKFERNVADVDFRLVDLLEYVKQQRNDSEESKGTNSESTPEFNKSSSREKSLVSSREESIVGKGNPTNEFVDDCQNEKGLKNQFEASEELESTTLSSDISRKFPICVENFFMSNSYSETDRKKIQLFLLNIEEALTKPNEKETPHLNSGQQRPKTTRLSDFLHI